MIINALAAFLSLAPLGLTQSTWYVDVNGTPPGTGTLADPYTSIQYAVTRPTTLPNDTVLVAPGTYVENIALNKNVRVKSSSGPALTHIHPAVAGNTVYISGSASTPALEGFTVTPAAPGTFGIGSAIFMEDGAVTRCIVHDPFGKGTPGMVVDGQSTVSECTLSGTGIVVSSFIGDLWLRNSIVTGSIGFGGNAVLAIDYSAGISGFDPNAYGVGNLAGDVGLWDAAHGDFRLRPGSQCIDSGDPTSPLDPDGSRIDIGALTFDPLYTPTPVVYCTAKTNSQGCVPSIGSSGAASASSASPFLITATNELNNKSGLLFYSHAEHVKPFQGAFHCVKLPTKRTPVQNSGGNPPPNDCSGAYSFDFNALVQSGSNPVLVPGVMVYAQYWGRDPGDAFQSSLTDALRFGIGL